MAFGAFANNGWLHNIYNKEMRSYQIMFDEGKPIAKGENFKANTPCDAILEFYAKYPGSTFIGLFDIEALSWFHINRDAVLKQMDRDERSL